ncbi:hypothetical protein SCHPADRAFT_939150 [Schizopora paradoxa]|uniref:TM7S3/TM198-like domain-containing protein n=1 Tax=Schizopora paradoxa TaxID=27342 RepID=A0A0H2RS81_9AGAM|nr:hypothetical protein SCHPADRAFT_939150 [Schizopora paradoxa]
MLVSVVALLAGAWCARPADGAPLQTIDGYQYLNESGIITIYSANGDFITQGTATDGGGVGSNGPAILWILFGIFLGLPLAGAGIRLGRYSTGMGFGLLLTFLSWIAIINTMSSNGIPDLAVVLVLFLLFLCGFVGGFFAIDFRSDVFLGLVGGASVAMRLVLLRDNLLIPVEFVNWLLIGLFGGLGFILSVFWQRLGVIFGTVSSGSFLVLIAIDSIVNQQDGLSRGLRLLFDKNKAHVADIAIDGYYPLATTLAWTSVSLALIPFAFGFQYYYWRSIPFWSPATERALSYYANSPQPAEKTVKDNAYIKKHREKPKNERASIGIDLKRGPKMPKPIRLTFGKSTIMKPEKSSEAHRLSF